MPNITVTITPTGANTNGAKWCVEGKSEWKASGTSYSAAAGSYVVQYKYAEGYSTPADAAVVVAGDAVAVSGVYGAISWKSTWNPPLSMCLFRGQVFACGAKHTTPDTVAVPSSTTLTSSDARLIRWSEIGAFRFLDCTANPLRNEAGEYYLGESDLEVAMKVLPLKNGVIAYGNFSTVSFRPVSEPVPSYAPATIAKTGIMQPLAVGGNDEMHLMIDRSGYLRSVQQASDGLGRISFTSTILGYQDIFGPMQADLSMATGQGVISVVYNPDDEEFYISDGRRSFMYADKVLTELGRAYTSYINQGGNLLVAHESTQITDHPLSCVTQLEATPYLHFATDPLNFGVSGRKTIIGVELLGSFVNAEAMVEWRNSKSEPFRETPWKRCSPSGAVSPMVTGSDLRIHCRTPYTESHVDSIVVEWQLSDRSAVRGNYVSNASA